MPAAIADVPPIIADVKKFLLRSYINMLLPFKILSRNVSAGIPCNKA
jgi:hypothetical protein